MCAISAMVLKPWVRQPTLQLPWSSATVAKTLCAPRSRIRSWPRRPRPSIRRCRRHSSFDATDPGRNVADEGDSDRRNREPQQLLQIEMPSLEAGLRHALSPIEFRRCSLRAKAQLLANFAGGKAQEQHGPVKRAVRNTPARLPVEAVDQLTDLTGLGGGVGTAREQRQQVRGARRLHVAVRLDCLQLNPAAVTSAGSRRMMYGACTNYAAPLRRQSAADRPRPGRR